MRKMAIVGALVAGLAAAASLLTAQTSMPSLGGGGSPTKPALPDGLKVVAISVSLPDPTSDRFVGERTELTLVLVRSDKGIIRLHEDSKLESFTDDKGTKLSVDQSIAWNIFCGGEVTPDGHRLKIFVKSKSVPASGAKSLTLKGKLVVLCSPETKEAVQKDVALAKDTQIELGPIKAKITKVSNEKWGNEEQLQVEFTNDSGFDALKELTFEDAQGKEIKAQHGGTFGSSIDGKIISATKSYSLTGKPDKVTIKGVYYEKIERVEVPIDLTFGLGL